MSDPPRRSARDLAVDALARRDHSRRELERKLGARGLERAEIAATLDDLASEGLQKDGRFADVYVRSRAERGYGPRRILQELRARGVSEELAAEALATAEVDWEALARAARRKKFRAPPGDAAARAKQSRFLEYRGFDAAQIRHALTQAANDEDL
ncbi:MAG: recombination regulator RecX [Gammaproteobacteria bacterium]|nr:recombination regulator RecX [Gammaproteobacteria bacterium]